MTRTTLLCSCSTTMRLVPDGPLCVGVDVEWHLWYFLSSSNEFVRCRCDGCFAAVSQVLCCSSACTICCHQHYCYICGLMASLYCVFFPINFVITAFVGCRYLLSLSLLCVSVCTLPRGHATCSLLVQATSMKHQAYQDCGVAAGWNVTNSFSFSST